MNVRTVLVPLDFAPCTLEVARRGVALAAQLGARVCLLHVTELPAGVTPGSPVPVGDKLTAVEDYVQADTTARLRAIADALAPAGAVVEVLARVGPVVPTILQVAKSEQADLLVLGTHGRTGLARVVLGSVAEAVAQEAQVPVTMIRRETRPECTLTSCEWCRTDGRSPAEGHLEVVRA